MRFCLVPSKRAKNSQPILNPFWISQRPVTLSQWNTAVIAGQVPFPSANPNSVVMMPEEDKAKFISWLGCRLPTQEELKFTLYGVDVNVSSPNWVGLDTTTDGLRVVLTEETYLNRPK
jgi:formylglycine-generating enzyme required for sulfatase activity